MVQRLEGPTARRERRWLPQPRPGRSRFGGKVKTLLGLTLLGGMMLLYATMMLFPAFSQGWEKGRARPSTCPAQLKQLTLALRMNAQDHDGLLPTYRQPGNFYIMWWDQLEPYHRNWELWKCPATQRARGTRNFGL